MPEPELVLTYRGFNIMKVCHHGGDFSHYYASGEEYWTKHHTTTGYTIEEMKAKIDWAWSIHYRSKTLYYKGKRNQK